MIPQRKRRGRPRLLGNAEIALAMELRTEGVRWKLIAYAFGVTEATMADTVRRAKRNGMLR